ncbi:MAG: aryl-sulfate sulfotransferase [Bacteroidales bacterium]|nr:aryl-sulfate sulfotransferase [Bacteroidales bacterium]
MSTFFPDIKIIESNGPSPGYFFLAAKGLSAPNAKYYIAIVDNYGTPVFFRLMPKVSLSMRLLKDGTIPYVHGVPRKLYIMDEMLNVIDTISTVGAKMDGHDYDIDDTRDYHRYLFAKYNRTVDMSQLLEDGNTAAEINEFFIQELDESNNVLNTWYTEDLFSILDGNEESPFVDFTEASIDYCHLNSVAVYSDTSFVVSSRHMDEITNIDKRTGEIIWRLGGKNNDFTFIDDPIGFSHQHCPRRLSNGNLILFDNGNLHNPEFSSTVEYELDEVNLTATLVNRVRRSPDAFAPRDGSTQRLDNDNTIITWGPVWPSVTEFHPDGSIAIELDMTDHSLSPRVEKYRWKTRVFETSVDTLDFGLIDIQGPVEQAIQLVNNTDTVMHITGFTTRTDFFGVNSSIPLEMQPGITTNITLSFDPGSSTDGFFRDVITLSSDNAEQRIACQIYLTARQEDKLAPTVTIVPDSSDVPVDPVITFSFSEAVTQVNGVELNYTNIYDHIIFRKNDVNGLDIDFTAKINTKKNRITARPSSLLDSNSVYYVSLDDKLTDYSENVLDVEAITFRTVDIYTAVEKEAENIDLNIYPNPAGRLLNIDMDYSGYINTSLYSISGIRIYSRNHMYQGKLVLDLPPVSPGIYLLIIRSENQKFLGNHKIMIK